jgi:hypothetical protein
MPHMFDLDVLDVFDLDILDMLDFDVFDVLDLDVIDVVNCSASNVNFHKRCLLGGLAYTMPGQL